MLSNWLKKTCATFFILSEIKPKPTETRLASPTCNYFEYLIGSPVITVSFWFVHCILLWLAGVIPYALVLQHSFENRSNSPYEKISIACHCQISFPSFFQSSSTQWKVMGVRKKRLWSWLLIRVVDSKGMTFSVDAINHSNTNIKKMTIKQHHLKAGVHMNRSEI